MDDLVVRVEDLKNSNEVDDSIKSINPSNKNTNIGCFNKKLNSKQIN
jgi:hypothetical protein